MANFCAKCGAEVTPDKQFCSVCGAPVASFTPVATYAPVVTPIAPAAQPVAPQASGGSSAVKIILIIVLIVVGLGILGAGAFGFMVWRVARSVHVNGPNGEVSINTPGGTISANPNEKFSASDLGTDVYPGAESVKGGMRITLPTGSSVTAIFVTSDSKDQVVSYYKGKFGSQASVFDSSNSAMLTVEKSKQETVMVTVTPNSSEHGGKTQIAIIHTISDKSS
jgi:F0F1-type ATP synthase assembly protein I